MTRHRVATLALLAGIVFCGVTWGQGTTTRPSTAPARSTLGPPIALKAASEFDPIAKDPIDRPAFRDKAHPVNRSVASANAMMIIEAPDGSEIGLTSDIIAAVAAGSRQAKTSSAVFVNKQAAVGNDMKVSFDEAVRAVKLRYPLWEPAKIEFSFADKYTPHDGGSAGTCFAVLMLSMLEDFEIDSKVSVTGDITADWKVRKIGGMADKIRGAVASKSIIAAIPEENAEQIGVMALMYGDVALRDIQVFSIGTLQEAVAVMRTDRSPRMVEAIKEFNALLPRMKTGKASLSDKDNQKALENIVELAPNHQSAKWLLAVGKGKAPTKLSPTFAFEQIIHATYPYRYVILGRQPVNRTTVTQAMTVEARKKLAQLAPITPPELQPLLIDSRAIIETSENIALRQTRPEVLEARRRSFFERVDSLRTNKEFVEKVYRQ